MVSKNNKGRIGEDIAFDLLSNAGVEIIARNYRTEFGEIDLIGIEKKTIIFIEVKLRTNDCFGTASESVDNRKMQRLIRCAESYISEKSLNCDYRIDVIAIKASVNMKSYEVDWFKNQENH